MSAAPARIFSSSSVEPLLLATSPAAAGNNSRQGRHSGDSVGRLSAAAAVANTLLLRNDFDLQVTLLRFSSQW